MPESVTTDNVRVATILAAVELTKAGEAIDRSPEALAKSFKAIFAAIVEAQENR